MSCFFVVAFSQFKQFWGVVTAAFNPLYLYIRNLENLTFLLAWVLARGYNESFNKARSLSMPVGQLAKRDNIQSCQMESGIYYELVFFFVFFCFELGRCSTSSQTSLNGVLQFSFHYFYNPRNWITYSFEFFCGCS